MKTRIILVSIFFVGLLGFVSIVNAQDWSPAKKIDDSTNIELFKQYKDYANVPNLNIVSPNIVEVDFRINDAYGNDFGVYNETEGAFVPNMVMQYEQEKVFPTFVSEMQTGKDLMVLFDRNSSTNIVFYLNNQSDSSVKISVEFPVEIKSNQINLDLGNYVTLPTRVTLKAVSGSKEVVVLNNFSLGSSRINFPDTVAKKWSIELEYSQMLSISEIRFNNLFDTTSKKSIRFLAVPNNKYKIYLNSERYVQNYANSLEKPDFYNTIALKYPSFLSVLNNPSFVPSDVDADSIPDMNDNCVSIYNPKQEDMDNNGMGDFCDDSDRDSVINSVDNCVNVSNYNQKDTDGDKIGDACDPDESRLTEKYPWIVWTGIGFAFLVFITLLFIAGIRMRKNTIVSTDTPNPDNNNPQA